MRTTIRRIIPTDTALVYTFEYIRTGRLISRIVILRRSHYIVLSSVRRVGYQFILATANTSPEAPELMYAQ